MTLKLWHKVTLGLICGIVFGLFCKDYVGYVKPVGDLFIRMIKMIIVPMIFFAIVGGITSVSDSRTLGRLGFKAAAAYILTTSFAIFIGFAVAWIMKPGVGLVLGNSPSGVPGGAQGPAVGDNSAHKIFSTVMDIIPDNAIAAMADGAVIQVVFFAIFTGITLQKMPRAQGQRIIDFFQLMATMVFKMVSLIVQLSPYAAFGLTAFVIGTEGASVIQNLGKFIASTVLACSVQYALFGVMIVVFGRLSPWPFYRKSLEYQAIAFSTSSSKAALATTIQVSQEKLGVSHASSNFVLPLGASINMDGMAIYLGMCSIFFAQAFGKTLGISDYCMIMLTATLGSIGGAGIPSASIFMLPMVLGSVGIPLDGIALIVGIDRILDMIRTTISITGDAVVALIIDSSEKKINRDVYYAP